MMGSLKRFLPEEAQRAIVQSIKSAELCTSGEIRVHVEPKCSTTDPCDRAVQVFAELRMHETAQRNAVLIYIAYKSRQFAIIGDKGINDLVPANFWDEEKSTLAAHLRDGRAGEGICKVIAQVGENLKKYFPYQSDDVNEQSDEISFGK